MNLCKKVPGKKISEKKLEFENKNFVKKSEFSEVLGKNVRRKKPRKKS